MMTEQHPSDDLLQELREKIQQLEQMLAKVTKERDKLHEELEQLKASYKDDGK